MTEKNMDNTFDINSIQCNYLGDNRISLKLDHNTCASIQTGKLKSKDTSLYDVREEQSLGHRH